MEFGKTLAVSAGILCLSDSVRAQGVDFRKIPDAQSQAQGESWFEARRSQVVQYVAAQDMPAQYSRHGVDSFWSVALARLESKTRMEEVHRLILAPTTQPWGLPGSDVEILGNLCKRKGDYDFALIGLSNIASRYQKDRERLPSDVFHKLIYILLNQTGGRATSEHFDLGVCGVQEESENHILMTEVSRYLTNQLRLKDGIANGKTMAQLSEFDNSRNGLSQWMLMHLQKFMKLEFREYNARPYQGYTVEALAVLYEFSDDPRVKIAAQNLLDYLAAKFAIQSAALKRAPPYRRLPQFQNENRLLWNETEHARYSMLTGINKPYLQRTPVGYVNDGVAFMLIAALGQYRIPSPILELFYRRPRIPLLQRIRHRGVEVYSNSQSYLISGGGTYVPEFDFWTGERVGRALPTTLIPTDMGTMRSELIRFAGSFNDNQRNNTCVARNFACGINFQLPAVIPQGCIENRGHWKFFNFQAPTCSLRLPFHVAAYVAPCESFECEMLNDGNHPAPNFGFFEAAETRDFPRFEDFRDGVLRKNGSRRYDSESWNLYTTQLGEEIVFTPSIEALDVSPIAAIHGFRQEMDLKKWPFLSGDFMSSNGNGRIEIKAPVTGRRVILDSSYVWNPTRSVQEK